MHLTRRHIAWAAVALLGIAVPAALTWSISRLAGQHIGLAAQPLSVVRGLAPARRDGPAGTENTPQGRVRPSRHRRSTPAAGRAADHAATTSTTSPLPAMTSPASTPAVSSAAAVTRPGVPSTAGPRATGGRGDESGGGSSSGPDD